MASPLIPLDSPSFFLYTIGRERPRLLEPLLCLRNPEAFQQSKGKYLRTNCLRAWRREMARLGTGLNKNPNTNKKKNKHKQTRSQEVSKRDSLLGWPQIDSGPFGPLVSVLHGLSCLPLAATMSLSPRHSVRRNFLTLSLKHLKDQDLVPVCTKFLLILHLPLQLTFLLSVLHPPLPAPRTFLPLDFSTI